MNNNTGCLDRRPALEPEAAAITGRLLPCEGEIVECLVRSVSKPGEGSEEDFRQAARHVRRIAFDEEGCYDPGTAGVALGHILGVIAAFTPSGPGLWRDVFDAAVRLDADVRGNA
jgi:hypothetical protein